MELKRRIALSALLVAAGLATGHVVQNRAAQQQVAAAATAPVPTAITPVAAGRDDAATPAPQATLPAPLPGASAATAMAPGDTPAAAGPALPDLDTAAVATSIPDVGGGATALAMTMTAPPIVAVPALAARVLADPSAGASVTPPALSLDGAAPGQAAPAAAAAAAACDVVLDLAAQDHAMIGLTLTAPCRADERVVVRHGGLVFTARTSATGSLFATVPGIEAGAGVSVLFADGDIAEASIDLPDLTAQRRFAVQWLADDAFQVHAFEAGADYGTPGHISAASPGLPLAGAAGKGGYLTVLGDATVDLPMLAQVYTFPDAADTPVDVVVETEVTEATCGRDLLGETLTSTSGAAFITELTVAMPDCDANGDILVLKNLVPDLKLAANN